MWNTGMASTTSTAPAATIEASGRRSTRSSTHDQARGSPVRRSGRRNGTRPLFTRSPSFDRIAGSTVSEPMTAIATTRIVPVANERNVGAPPKYMPAIAAITVTPETSTARPEVAAAASSAASSERPRARSSRSRRR
jgi:hypothetical protein